MADWQWRGTGTQSSPREVSSGPRDPVEHQLHRVSSHVLAGVASRLALSAPSHVQDSRCSVALKGSGVFGTTLGVAVGLIEFPRRSTDQTTARRSVRGHIALGKSRQEASVRKVSLPPQLLLRLRSVFDRGTEARIAGRNAPLRRRLFRESVDCWRRSEVVRNCPDHQSRLLRISCQARIDCWRFARLSPRRL